MKVTNAEMVISAVSSKQYPNDQLPEIALAGRSNVGKSSFINQLIDRKRLVRTSAHPGKTQTLNFYKINGRFYFVDVPGYGYAKVSKKEREKWAGMMETYFQIRNTLQLVVLITDSRHEPTQQDQQMYDYAKYLGFPVLVIATKYDKVPKGKRDAFLKRTHDTLEVEPEDSVLAFSAETGEGKKEAWRMLEVYL